VGDLELLLGSQKQKEAGVWGVHPNRENSIEMLEFVSAIDEAIKFTNSRLASNCCFLSHSLQRDSS
jgi:hypothetical protein